MSLNNLANRLSEAGQREEALETAREAVTIRRQLAQDSPAAYLPDLAMSLNNLANRLSEVGQRRAGAGGSPRGRHHPPAARPGQPRRLPPRPGHVAEQPRPIPQRGRASGSEALEAAREAVTHYRQLAQDSPAAYLPDLATSLNNLATASAEVGQRDEALETAREAVTHYRPARPGQPRRLPPRPGHVAEQPRQPPQRGGEDLMRQRNSSVTSLAAFPRSTSGVGHILLARGRWRAGQDRLADAIPDLTAALSAFERDGDRFARGQARQLLRGTARKRQLRIRPRLGAGA